jgi:uncharacterized protein (DUF1778 family)
MASKGIRRKRQTKQVRNANRVYIYVSDDEQKVLEEAASRQSTSVSGFVANAAIERAQRDLKKK